MKVFNAAAGIRLRSRSLTKMAGVALGVSLSVIGVPASAVELDSDGYARTIVDGTPGAVELWIEVEDPVLSADNTRITVDGNLVTTINTPFGAAAIVKDATKDVEIIIGVSVAADPDIAFTAVNAAGASLYEEHYRTGMTASRPRETTAPTPGSPVTPAPVVTATVAPMSVEPVKAPGSAERASDSRSDGILADTGAMLGLLIPVGLALLALGIIAVAAARRKARA